VLFSREFIMILWPLEEPGWCSSYSHYDKGCTSEDMRSHYQQEQKISVFSEACFPGSTQFPVHLVRGGGVFIAHTIFFCQSVN